MKPAVRLKLRCIQIRVPRAFMRVGRWNSAVAWAYKHDPNLKLPYQDNLSALVHERTFKQAAGEAVFSKAREPSSVMLGNRAVHSHRAIPLDDALVAAAELFHVAYSLGCT